MDFVHYDLGYLVEGTTVVVSLDVAANVCVLDFANFMYYKMDISFMYLGGYITVARTMLSSHEVDSGMSPSI